MNIMLVSVTVRTQEIGLRMALGARRSDILAQFLVDAVVLCSVAGLIGVALGWLGAAATAKAAGWRMTVELVDTLMALAASVGVGVVFGYMPATRAASLDPIEALRRERI